jgi:predicted nucleic-acid-binding protein
MSAVDTNVLVRLLVADDPVQTKRATAFLQARRPVWISTVVLVETVWVLMTVYRWSKAQILAMLHTATNSRDFAFQAVDPVRRAAYAYASSKIDFSDCLALELARAEGRLPFATFDKATAKLSDAISPP